MAILNFIGRVTIAERIVKEKYPNVMLFEVQGKPSKGIAESANDIDELKAVFNVMSEDEGKLSPHVIIESTGWGEFGEPQFFEEPWLEDCVIDWPLEMDLAEAQKIKESAGYTGAYKAVTLRKPLHPNVKNPYYIFAQTDRTFVFVDVVTKEVTTE